MPANYEISADGKSIRCLACGKRSHNENDVREKYCGHCKKFHDVTADALIAGAVKEEAQVWYKKCTSTVVPGEWMEWATERLKRLAAPDAARLALEEREAKIRIDTMIWCTGAMSLNERDNAVIPKKAIKEEEAKLTDYEKIIAEDTETLRKMQGNRTPADVAEREAKLIADTLRAAADIADGVDSTDFAIQWTSAKVAAAIRALTPAQIVTQAEERDRRMISEAVQPLLDKLADFEDRKHLTGDDITSLQVWWSRLQNERLAAHRAAVQEKQPIKEKENSHGTVSHDRTR